MSPEARVIELGLSLPTAPAPMGTYSPAVRHGDLLYVSGHGPLRADGSYITGRLGAGLDTAAGRDAARLTALAVLATLRRELGTLDRVRRVVKVLGMVSATPEFAEHPQVVNGFSDVMVLVFGEAGRAARSAVGTASLPAGIAVEVEAIFAVGEEGVPS
jgi:enamine deaminase RidA (YjgF/YER057c/UK114 family)